MSGIPGVDVKALLSTAALNADYRSANAGAGDAAKCLAFQGAISSLLIVVAQRQSQGGANRQNEVQIDGELWERRLQEAEVWFANNQAATTVGASRVRQLGVGAWR